MQKYSLLREAVQAFAPDSLEVAPAAKDDELLLVHDAAYVDRMSNGTLTATEIRQIGFPWSPFMAERARRSSGATLAAARASLTEQRSTNDALAAARVAPAERRARSAMNGLHGKPIWRISVAVSVPFDMRST